MKQPLIVSFLAYLLLFSVSCSPSSPGNLEAEFLDRFKGFIQEGDFSEEKLKEVWLFGDAPEALRAETLSSFQKLKEQGIGESRFHEVYPKLLEGMKQPFEFEGELYSPNLDPYKMVEITFAEEIEVEHGSEDGWSMVLGESQGKLYLMGYQKQIKAE